jgi:protein associated with RNAse G/E
VELASEKWGGHPHYRGVVHRLGEDEDGTWVWGPAGRTIYRGDDVVFVTEYDALTLIAPGAWWAPAWWIGHPEMELYVNINTPAVWERDRIVSIDLDLDVVRWSNGLVEIVDRDEFELHRVKYGYPIELIESAETATAEAHDLVSRNRPPFDGVAAKTWAERALGKSFSTWSAK